MCGENSIREVGTAETGNRKLNTVCIAIQCPDSMQPVQFGSLFAGLAQKHTRCIHHTMAARLLPAAHMGVTARPMSSPSRLAFKPGSIMSARCVRSDTAARPPCIPRPGHCKPHQAQFFVCDLKHLEWQRGAQWGAEAHRTSVCHPCASGAAAPPLCSACALRLRNSSASQQPPQLEQDLS